MKWNVSASLTLDIDYDDIEADTKEEAEQIAKDRALEDVEFNNCNCNDTVSVYCCYSNDELEDK